MHIWSCRCLRLTVWSSELICIKGSNKVHPGGYAERCQNSPWSMALIILISCCKCYIWGVKYITFLQQMCHMLISVTFFRDACFCWMFCLLFDLHNRTAGCSILARAPQRNREACWGIQPVGLGSGIILGWNARWRERGQETDTSQCSVAVSTINAIAKQGP